MTAMFVFLLFTYLFAAIPFGVVITTLYGDDRDIRGAGSKNIGVTNVARVYSWSLAIPVLFLDVGKGFFPVLIAWWIFPEGGALWLGAVALVAFLAHCFPVYLEFRGGKGVATGGGAMLALAPFPTLVALGIWVTVLAITGRSSVASLLSALSLMGLTWFFEPQMLPLVVVLGMGVAYTHAANIARLMRGEEEQVVRPVRWGRKTVGAPSGLQVLEEGPGGAVGAALWKETLVDPLEEAGIADEAEE